MYRLFVAIDLPDGIKNSLADIRSDLPGARWVAAEQLHLTLRFIGEVDDLLFAQIQDVLANVTGSPFHMTLTGIGHFPPGKHARVLWVGMETNEDLLELQRDVELALINAGIAPEERRFSPHITIARMKDIHETRIVAFEEKHREFRTFPFPVDAFHLYSSTLSREGAIHKQEATYPLIVKAK